MDAEYYYSVGIRLFEGEGFSENFIWNYLNDPEGMPQPSHLYWMPLTSLLSTLGMVIIGSKQYYAARVIFIVIASALPIMTTLLALIVTGKMKTAILAGCFSIITGFYFAYISNTDTFPMQMLLGTLFLITLNKKHNLMWWDFIRGLLIGLLHLNRADGIVWLIPAFALPVIEKAHKNLSSHDIKIVAHRDIVIGLGYLIPMGGWYLRNLILFNSLFPPGNSRALWITSYNQLFAYPPTVLTFSNWVQSGFNAILSSRLHALGSNLLTLIAVQGLIVLTPLIFMGFWNLRKKIHVQIGIGVWAILFTLMTLIFPIAGERGGFFHSGAAIQPLFYVLAADGFYCFIQFGIKLRQWNYRRAQKGFIAIVLAACIFVTASSFQRRMFDPNTGRNIWNDNWNTDLKIEKLTSKYDPDFKKVIMINNPPGYSLVSKRPAIIMPDGNVHNLELAARRFSAEYLVIEEDHISGYREFFENPGSRDGFYYLGSIESAQLYRIELNQ